MVLKIKAFDPQFDIIFQELIRFTWGNNHTPRKLDSAIDYLINELKIIPDAVIKVWKIGRR